MGAEELLEMREAFPHGKMSLRIEEDEFSLRNYHKFLAGIRPEAEAFKKNQQAAFDAERDRWQAAGLDRVVEAPEEIPVVAEITIPAGCRALKSPAHGSIWTIAVSAGDRVEAGRRLLIVESMKMEIAVATPVSGTVVEVLTSPGTQVAAGQPVIFIRPE